MDNFIYFPISFDPTYNIQEEKINKGVKFPQEWNLLEKSQKCDKNRAIVTGKKSNITVLDFDDEDIYFKCIQEIPNLENYYTVKTRKGFHIYFQYNSNLKNTTNVFKNRGVDIRNDGGCIIAPPSSYSYKDEVFTYEFMGGEILPMPDLLLQKFKPDVFKQNEENNENEIDEKQPTNGNINDVEEIKTVLFGLSKERVENFDSWIQVGFALKNSGYSVELWDEWSKQSSKYKINECYKRWRTFKSTTRKITISTLYYWLREDSPKIFYEIQSNKDSIQKKIITGTNASIAELFYEFYPNYLLYSSVTGWYILKENFTWLPINSLDYMSIPGILKKVKDVVTDLICNLLPKIKDNEELRKKVLETGKKAGSASFLKGVVSLFSSYYYKENVEKLFNQKLNLFAFTNGVLDLEIFETRQIEPEDYITVTTGYDYRESQIDEKEKVRQFLRNIFPNEPVLKYVLRVLSKCLSGQKTDQVAHIFTGIGSNGKSLLMLLCKYVFGEYYQTFSVSYLTKEDNGKDKPLPELESAKYSRILVTSEPEENDKFQISILKNLTGNEEVTFRGMYSKQPTKYIPQFMIFILLNQFPKLSKFDAGIERRLRAVHFPTRFVYNPVEENEKLRDDSISIQFKSDDSWKFGLLGLLIDTYLEYGNEVLVMPEDVQKITDEYLLSNNPVGLWLKTYYEKTGLKTDLLQKTELYRQFLEDTGTTKSQKVFSEDMIKCNILDRQVDSKRYYYGLRRKEEIVVDQ